MSTLLLQISGSRELNHTLFPPHLYIYDDLLIYKKRRMFKVTEITISYSHIVQVNLLRGLLFSSLEIDTPNEDQTVKIKWINKKNASLAKKIIDQKVYNALPKHKAEPVTTINQSDSFEKNLNRLKELLNRGRISKREYEKRRADYLKNIR